MIPGWNEHSEVSITSFLELTTTTVWFHGHIFYDDEEDFIFVLLGKVVTGSKNPPGPFQCPFLLYVHRGNDRWHTLLSSNTFSPENTCAHSTNGTDWKASCRVHHRKATLEQVVKAVSWNWKGHAKGKSGWGTSEDNCLRNTILVIFFRIQFILTGQWYSFYPYD